MLQVQHLYIVSIANLIFEADASYIRGMLSNPDVQPNTTINQWIATILLFNFKLVHIPADKHQGPDGLSRWGPVPGEEEEDNPEDWVNHVLSLGIWIVSWLSTTSMSTTATLILETNSKDNSTKTQWPQRDCQPLCAILYRQVHSVKAAAGLG